MAQKFDSTNTFTLNKNDKGDNPKRPDYKGSVLVRVSDLQPDANGVARIWLSGWIRNAPDGGKFISGAVQAAEQKGEAPKPAATEQKPLADLEDDIPF